MELDWITTTEAAELSGYTPVHLRDLLRNGAIKGQKWVHDWQVSRKSLFEYLSRAEKRGKKRGRKRKV